MISYIQIAHGQVGGDLIFCLRAIIILYHAGGPNYNIPFLHLSHPSHLLFYISYKLILHYYYLSLHAMPEARYGCTQNVEV